MTPERARLEQNELFPSPAGRKLSNPLAPTAAAATTLPIPVAPTPVSLSPPPPNKLTAAAIAAAALPLVPPLAAGSAAPPAIPAPPAATTVAMDAPAATALRTDKAFKKRVLTLLKSTLNDVHTTPASQAALLDLCRTLSHVFATSDRSQIPTREQGMVFLSPISFSTFCCSVTLAIDE